MGAILISTTAHILGAAMEPGLGDREWGVEALATGPALRLAAMEPGLGDREWRGSWGKGFRARSCRNGARSWRPGMAGGPSSPARPDTMPQWSPVLETGNGALPGEPGG